MNSIAVFVATLALLVSVSSALACYRLWKMANRRLGIASLRAEVDELRDSYVKTGALLKRINLREAIAERRAAGNGLSDDPQQQPGESSADWKRRARKLLVTPGKPVQHR